MYLFTCLIILLASTINYGVEAGNALSACSGGRGVPALATDSGGACGIPAQAGIYTTNLNQAFFDGGAKCGECYEVTGPLGTVTVMVSDMCSSAAPKCEGDRDNFGIANAAYFQIANSSTDIIFDLGYRRVTCDVTGNVKLLLGSDSNEYYFSVVAYNSKVAIKAVGVKCAGWSNFQALARGTNSARWSWYKAANAFQFPATISLVGETGEVLQFIISSWQPGATIDFQSQFADVPAGVGRCPLAQPPQHIYEDSVAYGWITIYSFKADGIKDDTTTFASGTSSLAVNMYGYGGLQFTRNGGFDPLYFTTLQFAAKANGQASLRIYIGELADGEEGGVTLTNAITTEWQTFNISLADLKPSNVEFFIVFQNFGSNTQQFWFDNIKFVLAPISPLANVTYTTTSISNDAATTAATTTTTSGGSSGTGSVSGTGLVSTSAFNFDTGANTGDTENSSAAIVSSLGCVFVLVIALALQL